MEEMVERCGKAVESLGSVDPANYRDRQAIVLAVIGAMREPTDAMVKAWLLYYSDPNDETGFSIQAKPVWQLMIDAALTTPGE